MNEKKQFEEFRDGYNKGRGEALNGKKNKPRGNLAFHAGYCFGYVGEYTQDEIEDAYKKWQDTRID